MLRIAPLITILPLLASPTSSDRLVPHHQGKKWGFADPSGHVVLAPGYDQARRFADGRAAVQRDRRWGLIDPTGREVVPPLYSLLGPFSEGLAAACTDTAIPTGVTEGVGRERRPVVQQACGFVDRDGRMAVPARYHGVNRMIDGVAQVRLHNDRSPCLVAEEWGLVRRDGHEILPVRFCFVSPPSEGLVRVVLEESSLEVRRFAFYDLDGHVAIPRLPYDHSHEFWSEGVIGVSKAGRFGFIDHSGREVIPLRFESAYPFSEGLAAVELDGKWGFVDHSGLLVVAPRYDRVESFRDGLAWVRLDRSAGFVDRSGRLVVPLEFDGWIDSQWRPDWSGGLCAMKARDGGWGFIDRTGRWVILPVHELVMACSDGLCAARKDRLWGFFDTRGLLKIPFRYLRAEPFDGGFAYVSRRLRPDLPVFAEGWIDTGGREFFDAAAR